MADEKLPAQMRAQQFSSAKGGIEHNLKLNSSAPLPKRKPEEHLVQVIASALNPVDHKVAEIPLVTTLFLSKPVTPGLDFVGKIVEPAAGSSLKPGQIVFGVAGKSPLAGSALADFAIARRPAVAALPSGVDPIWAATIGIAGLTAYQSIVPHVNDGSNVFINGGSGGTGIFGIQIAKAKGCYVATTCSTPNVELCRSLGADEVIDYKKSNVLSALKESGRKWDHVVDNVGNMSLYFKAHEYTSPKAIFVQVGGHFSWGFMGAVTAAKTLPGFLGGGKRKLQGFFAEPKDEDLAQIGKWMASGQVKPIFDSRFKLEDAAKAFEKLKTGRAKGKVVVEVNPDLS